MAQFFEHGQVEVVCSDETTRQLALRVQVPWCVLQPPIPSFLHLGFMDGLRIKHPFVTWIPTLDASRFCEEALAQVPNAPKKVSQVMQNHVSDSLQLFLDASSIVKNPDDFICMLPMGTYVEFQYRTTYENLANLVEKLPTGGTAGAAEFRFALASALAEVLASSAHTDKDGVPLLPCPAVK